MALYFPLFLKKALRSETLETKEDDYCQGSKGKGCEKQDEGIRQQAWKVGGGGHERPWM